MNQEQWRNEAVSHRSKVAKGAAHAHSILEQRPQIKQRVPEKHSLSYGCLSAPDCGG